MSNPFSIETIKIFKDQVEVFPLAIRDLPLLQPIAERMTTLITAATGGDLKSIDRKQAVSELGKLIKGDGVKLLNDLYQLIQKSCEPQIPDRAPYYVLHEAIQAWWKLSFESESARPTIALVEKILQSTSGDPTMSFGTIKSMLLSGLDTASTTSSTKGDPAGRSPAGAIQSSADDSTQPIDPTVEDSAKTHSPKPLRKAPKLSTASKSTSMP